MKDIWHEPGEKPTRKCLIYFLYGNGIQGQIWQGANDSMFYSEFPWCYGVDLAAMLHELRAKAAANVQTDEAKEPQSALDRQVGGNHYKGFAIQPIDFIEQNKIPFTEGCVIKYVTRHREKGKAADIRKAIHFLEMLLEREYPEAKS